MLLSEPGRTDYDFHFNWLGFDVRVHPGFFLVSALIGRSFVDGYGINTGTSILMGIVLFFVSILVHEVGHSLAFQYYGISSRICLYWLGGLAIPQSGGLGRRHGLSHAEGIVVSLAGPFAGFLLGVFFVLLAKVIAPDVPTYHIYGVVPCFYAGTEEIERQVLLLSLVQGFILINVLYSLLNLLPIWPLDGGQVARHLFEMFDQFDGTRKSLMLSIATCVICGVYSLKIESTFSALFCFYLAFQSYQQLNPSFGKRW